MRVDRGCLQVIPPTSEPASPSVSASGQGSSGDRDATVEDGGIGGRPPGDGLGRDPGAVAQIARVGGSVTDLVFLGPAADGIAARSGRLVFPAFGLDVGVVDGRIDEIVLLFLDPQPGFRSFAGLITVAGKSIDRPADQSGDEIRRRFGEPCWRFADASETLWFYELEGDLEWQLEWSPEGRLMSWAIGRPLLADPGNAAIYGFDQPWPPPVRLSWPGTDGGATGSDQ